MTEKYPDNCLRGISIKEHIFGNSVVWQAFTPVGNPVNGWRESSINWELDDGAEKEILNRKKNNGEIQFKGGAVMSSSHNSRRAEMENHDSFTAY